MRFMLLATVALAHVATAAAQDSASKDLRGHRLSEADSLGLPHATGATQVRARTDKYTGASSLEVGPFTVTSNVGELLVSATTYPPSDDEALSSATVIILFQSTRPAHSHHGGESLEMMVRRMPMAWPVEYRSKVVGTAIQESLGLGLPLISALDFTSAPTIECRIGTEEITFDRAQTAVLRELLAALRPKAPRRK
jgi:hypothetical protein